MAGNQGAALEAMEGNQAIAGNAMCHVFCTDRSFLILKDYLRKSSPLFRKELEKSDWIFLTRNKPITVVSFIDFLEKKKKEPEFKEIEDFEDTLDFSLQYDTMEFYSKIGKKNLKRYLSPDTILTFLTIGSNHQKTYYTQDLFNEIKNLPDYFQAFNKVIVENSNAKQLKYYLSNLKPSELPTTASMTMILDWVKTSPTATAESIPEMIDVVHLMKLNNSQIMSFYGALVKYVDENRLWTAIEERMMVEQTTMFVINQREVDTYYLNTFGRIQRNVHQSFSFSDVIITLFRYLDTIYFITTAVVPNRPSQKSTWLRKWRESATVQMKHEISLPVPIDHKVYASAVGPLVFILFVDPDKKYHAEYEATVIKLNVEKPSIKTTERLIHPFLFNEIKCSRSSVYLLSYSSDSRQYDAILKINHGLTFKLLMPLDGFRQPDRKWECSAICNDRLYVFGFNLIESDAASNTPNCPFRMTFYIDDIRHSYGEWLVKETQVPWRKFHTILNFYDKYQVDDIFKNPNLFVNFIADDKFMYQFNPQNRKFRSHVFHIDLSIPKDNIIVTLTRRR